MARLAGAGAHPTAGTGLPTKKKKSTTFSICFLARTARLRRTDLPYFTPKRSQSCLLVPCRLAVVVVGGGGWWLVVVGGWWFVAGGG